MLILVTAHLILALCAPSLMRAMGRRGFLILALGPAAGAAYAFSQTIRIRDGNAVVQSVNWLPELHLTLDFRIDTLSWLMLLIVGAVGAIVLVYCTGYFSASATGLGRFGGVFVAFAGAMAGLVTADNTMLLFVFWELTTVFSYLLIGHYSDRKSSRRAAMQAIVITTTGGLAMLTGFIMLGESDGGSYRLSTLMAHPPHGTVVSIAVVCVLAGVITKSALFPFHFWLPSAMAAPTPVSAYLHAAAMVKAGVYVVARFAPGFSALSVWTVIIVSVGVSTFLLGGYRALRQHDLKLVLAYGTVSQLGLLVLLLGIGTRSAAIAGLAMLGAHAMFKATLFLTTGAIDVITGTRDLRRLSGVARRAPALAVAAGLATASMIGLPPMLGYIAKEAALESVWHDGLATGPEWMGSAMMAVMVIGSAMTAGYGLRFWWGAFATKPIARSEECIDPQMIRRPGRLLTWCPMLLAVGGLVAGLMPGVGQSLLSRYAEAYPRGSGGHLTLWSGVSPSLLATALALGAGLLLFVYRDQVGIFQQRISVPFEAEHLYRRAMRRLDDVAADLTAITQRGSLPFYLSVILTVLVIGPGLAVLTASAPERVRLWDSPAQLVPMVVIVVVSVLVARSRRRLKAVLLAGFAGYSTAALFVLHGAPDLALTQVLVETITLVVMVLVLRKLPPYFSDRPLARSRWTRLALATAVGVVVMALAIVVPAARVHAPVTAGASQLIYDYGGGRNLVNVILVDTRAWDTMGEIAVLLVAATGVASLLFLRRRTGEIYRAADAPASVLSRDGGVWGGIADRGAALRRQGLVGQAAVTGLNPAGMTNSTIIQPTTTGALGSGAHPRRSTWLRAGQTLAPQRRSLIFEVVTRLIYHSMVVFGIYLLFAGHNQPGGGFAAGLVVGIALIVRYLAGGRYELGEALPVQPGLLLGAGLFLAVGDGVVSMWRGQAVLESSILHLHVALLGDIKLVTALFFDIGVFLVVVGLVLDILRSLGAEIDKQGEVPR